MNLINKRVPKGSTTKKKSKTSLSADLVPQRTLRSFRETTHTFVRTCRSSSIIVSSSGINSTGFYDLNFRFSLASTFQYQNGALIATTSNPGASELTALFRQYRIKRVEVMLNYSNNGLPGSANVNQLALPTFVTVYEPDGNTVATESNMLQRGDSVIVQLGNARQDVGYTVGLTPVPSKVVLQQGDAAGNASGASPDWSNPWIDSSTPSVEYNGYNMFYMSPPTTSSIVQGIIVPVIRYTIECCGSQ